MRIALGESDRKRAAASSPNASPAAARSRPRRPDSLLSLSSSKLSDKENCVGGGPPRTRASPFHRPNDEFVCVELPVDQSYANKRLRGIASSEVSSKARSQAPRKSRHNYLKPGTLAKVRDAAHKAGRKRVAEGDGIHAAERSTRFFDGGVRHASASPERVPHAGIAPRWLGPACLQRKKLLAPKFLALPPLQPAAANEAVPMVVEEVPAPAARSSNEEQSRDAGTGTAQPSSSSSSVETLPPELLVRIVCRLDHNQLKPVFHVCRSLRQAVMIAKQCHFNFTTPGKDHKTVSDAKLGQALPFLNEFAAVGISTTPNAPKHAEKFPKPRYSMADMRQIAATLFQGSQSQPLPPNVRVPMTRAGASHRVLFNEEELCKAIAQNTL
ncbi:hypothetical protein SELMODRAFT_402840 [Selaginella moellendorffii]|uniref:F-box domain-containing protein n=1 Tax=Selaginella moellendorffii TaxID=88036 RepID=D8QN76_SELML|nr:F-box protein At4g35930 [Selaginella moellendorffii]EFJ38709.1 hypothetical protein SELMODRAFT_402840 [Selaginella moellendorffii]|eukprot:XP_002961170.1 F-box protein At4g35930 [Selaginella moellendorffii]